MINLIVGSKGSGKTKRFVEMINNSVKEAVGSIACIEKGSISTIHVNHDVRLINTDIFNVADYSSLYGLIAGVYASNFDVEKIFIDATLRIGGRNFDDLLVFLRKIDAFSKKFNIEFIFTISCDISELTPNILEFCKII